MVRQSRKREWRPIFLDTQGVSVEVDAELGSPIMQTAVANDVKGIVGECGGTAACRTCHVYVEPQ